MPAPTPRSGLVSGDCRVIAACLGLHIPRGARQPAPEFFKDQMKSLAGKPFGGKTMYLLSRAGQVPIAAVTNDHKLSGVKQTYVIVSQF